MVDYSQLLSERVKVVKPSGIRKFFDIVATMEGAISLGVGEPDFETPVADPRAGIASLEKGKTFYTSNWGLAELRVEIAKNIERKYGLTYDPQKEILVTVGGSEAIDNAIRAFINPGDEVLIPEPSFVCYTPLTIMAGGTPGASADGGGGSLQGHARAPARGDYAAHQNAGAALPEQPDRRDYDARGVGSHRGGAARHKHPGAQR